VDLDRYLARLGFSERPAPTADSLRRLHVAHLAAFPFHNLTIQRNEVVDINIDAITQRFLTEGGGGYCFEQNTLLGTALRELGFDVTTLLGRVGIAGNKSLNHMLLRVDVDGESWIADVGFGGEGPLDPIPLRENARVTQDGIDFSLQRDAHHWILSMHYGDVTEELYEFSGAPHTSGDVEIVNYYTSMHPTSIFRRTLTIQRVTPEERLILRPKVVTRYRNGVRNDTPIEPSQVRAFARELFGIELGEGPLLFESHHGLSERKR
jgi:N-hydroxyarylamine O-acetyltransferase